ncbi:MAG: TatD family hydrolase [Chloroflexi bacterium]|nr:TatD family hydrolase [Chloroflexota bacterium]
MNLSIDIHTHIDQHDPADLPAMLERSSAAAVGTIVVAGVTVESSQKAVALANKYETVFAAVGMHPQDLTGPISSEDEAALSLLATDPLVVAMSEIGLDYQPTSPDHDVQEEALRIQIDIARRNKLPVIWHMRDATPDCLRILRDERINELGGAAHYFQGSWDDATTVMDLGCVISLAKPLLRLTELQEVAKRVPLESIVLETDSYPQPFKKSRDKWTEPKDVALVAAKLAELKGCSMSEVVHQTTDNALTLLGERGTPIRDQLNHLNLNAS